MWTRNQNQSRAAQVPDNDGEEVAGEMEEEEGGQCEEQAGPFSHDQQPRSAPHISLNHHSLEEVFFAAGRMARSREDPIHPEDLQVVAIDGSESKAVSFVEWAEE